MDGLLIGYCGIAAVSLLVCALTLLQTWEHRRYHRKRLAADAPATTGPHVMLFVPCKGIDLDFDDNLRSLLTQDYENYELCFIVESLRDPAVAAIEQARRRYSRVQCQIVVAGLADNCGQKVHNLIAATRQIPPHVEVLAFADSDACPSSQWLGRMVARTSNSRTGVVTGYRWFVPQRPTLINRIAAAMNNQLAGNLGLRMFNLVWGGSWAMRRDVFERLKFPRVWHGCLNDDLIVTRRVREAGLKVVYEPRCLVASTIDFDGPALLEFARRQYFQVRVVTPRWWWLGLAAAMLVTGMYAASALAAVYGTLGGGPVALPLLVALAFYGITALRTAARQRSMRPFLRVSDDTFRRVTRFETFATPITALVHLVAIVSSAWGRRIIWRGIHYVVTGPHQTRIVSRPVDQPTMAEETRTAA